MRAYTDSVPVANAVNPEDDKIVRWTNMLSLILLGLAMAILWVVFFGF